jgi:bacterioferritin-associated ferredoxin
MIICHCAGLTDRDIARVVAEGARTVGDITRRCGAGRNCAPCRAELEQMLAGDCPGECGVEAAA